MALESSTIQYVLIFSLSITLFRSIAMLCGTDNIPHSIPIYSPHNIALDLNNVMSVVGKISNESY
jgi:hypothetical protein